MLTFTAVITQLMVLDGANFYSWDPVNVEGQTGNHTIDGTPETMDVEGYEINPEFSFQTGIIALIIVMIAVGVIAGIHVLGSGLSDTSINVIYKSVFFYSVWILLSVFGYPAINSVPVFGWILYFTLTLLFSLGVVEQIQGTSMGA